MPGTAIGQQMNVGYPGSYARNGDCVIASRWVRQTDTANINFGDTVVLNQDSTGGTYSQVAGFIAGAGTFTAAIFAGIAVREVKSYEQYFGSTPPSAPTFAYYGPGSRADVIKRGCVVVQCRVGTPKAGSGVYIRTVYNAAIPAGIVGGIEAAADGTNTVAIPNAQFFTGTLDANGCTEIELLSINTV